MPAQTGSGDLGGRVYRRHEGRYPLVPIRPWPVRVDEPCVPVLAVLGMPCCKYVARGMDGDWTAWCPAGYSGMTIWRLLCCRVLKSRGDTQRYCSRERRRECCTLQLNRNSNSIPSYCFPNLLFCQQRYISLYSLCQVFVLSIFRNGMERNVGLSWEEDNIYSRMGCLWKLADISEEEEKWRSHWN